MKIRIEKAEGKFTLWRGEKMLRNTDSRGEARGHLMTLLSGAEMILEAIEQEKIDVEAEIESIQEALEDLEDQTES